MIWCRTTQLINLQGLCNNELPQFVAKFNGQTSNIHTQKPIVTGQASETVSIWFYLSNSLSSVTSAISIQPYGQNSGSAINLDQGSYMNVIFWVFLPGNVYPVSCNGCVLSPNKWYFVSATYDGTYMRLYLNGNLVNQTAEVRYCTAPADL